MKTLSSDLLRKKKKSFWTLWTCTTTRWLALSCLSLLLSCQSRPKQIQSYIHLSPSPQEVRQYTPLPLRDQAKSDWGQEYMIGSKLAREGDYYRAITAFKRSLLLLPDGQNPSAKMDIQYNIALSYYLGKHYEQALPYLEPLQDAPKDWEGASDASLLYYECLQLTGQRKQAQAFLKSPSRLLPSQRQELTHIAPILEGDIQAIANSKDFTIRAWGQENLKLLKSPEKAQILNGVLPGAGYFYLGKTNTAITSFLLNALFIAAAYRLFDRHHVALGILTTGIEFGWYFGGIYGAKESALRYNQLTYEKRAHQFLKEKRLAPALMIRYGF